MSKIFLSKISKATGMCYAFKRRLTIGATPSEKSSYLLWLFPYHLFVLILVGFSPLNSVAQTAWQPLTDQEAGFTVSFPGKATYEQVDNPQGGGPKEIYKFQYGENFLSVTITPLLRIPRNSLELSQAHAEIAREFSDKGTLVRQEKLPDGGRQYYNISNESSGRLTALIRSYIYRGRHYQLVYGTFAPASVNEPLAERFFSSFRFLEIRPNKGASSHKRLENRTTHKTAKRSRWYVLRGTAGDFTVEFPSRPEYSRTLQPEIGTDVHKFRFFFGENLYVLSYWEVPGAKTQSPEILHRVVSAHVAGETARGEVLKQVKLPEGGYEVESRGVFNNLLLHSRVRFYARGTRIYTLTTMTPNIPGPNRNDLDRFFASFHLRKS